MFHQARPPHDDAEDETYVYWPITDATTMQDFTESTWTGGNKWAFMWSNRYNYGDAWNKRPNYLIPSVEVDGKECRSVFTTMAKADAATRAQVRYMMGHSISTCQQDWIAAGGSSGDFVTEAAYVADPATYCTEDFTWDGVTYRVMKDTVVLFTPRLPNGLHPETNVGVVLDYEVGDTRTPEHTRAFIEDIAADLHAGGYQLFFYTNPLTAATMQYHGVDETNLPDILDACDFVGMALTSFAPEGSVPAAYDAQLARLGTIEPHEWGKLVIVFELGVDPGTTLADARWVHHKLHEDGSDHPDKVMFWRYYATPGAPLTNEKKWLVCFGQP